VQIRYPTNILMKQNPKRCLPLFGIMVDEVEWVPDSHARLGIEIAEYIQSDKSVRVLLCLVVCEKLNAS
jgi:hypothetical protein